MSWAEHMAAEVAPNSKYGMKRWTEAFAGLEDEEFRAEVAQVAINLDSPGILHRFANEREEGYA